MRLLPFLSPPDDPEAEERRLDRERRAAIAEQRIARAQQIHTYIDECTRTRNGKH